LWPGLLLASAGLLSTVAAQDLRDPDGLYFPLSQNSPPGLAAQWAMIADRCARQGMQPVRVLLPSTGQVTFYQGTPQAGVELRAPAQASLLVGTGYRLRLASLPEFPGAEFFPSVELIDRLHPPPGQADRFPVEIEFTQEELRWSIQGRLITKVLYLEQPNRVQLTHLHGESRITDLDPQQNAFAEADVLGRPLAIIRLGGRTPDPHHPEPLFFGPGGPVQLTAAPARNADPALPPAPRGDDR
jgi:hypothetical protein